MGKKKKVENLQIVSSETVKSLAPKAPEWVAKAEDIGNATFGAAQEFFLVIQDVLRRYHKFSDEDLKNLHEELKPILKGVSEYERAGLSLLSPGDIAIVGEIAQTRLLKERAWRAGLETPILPSASPFIKALKEKNKGK